MVIKNKKASYEYFLLEEFEAGMILTGTEIKSIRKGSASINEAYCIFQNGELFIRDMHIAEYLQGSYNNHEEKRMRKLLLKRSEVKKLHKKVKEKGLSIVPVKIFFSDRGFAKIVISLAKGKKSFDKRETIKRKDQKRDLDRSQAY
jgi:SsrA-binding protein